MITLIHKQIIAMAGYHACSAFINDDVAVCVDSYDYQTCTHDDDDAEILWRVIIM